MTTIEFWFIFFGVFGAGWGWPIGQLVGDIGHTRKGFGMGTLQICISELLVMYLNKERQPSAK